MYNEIGKKIKGFSIILFLIGLAASIISGVGIAISYGSFWLFLLIAVFGSLFSYVGGLFIYGFGELIDKTTEVAENTTYLRRSGTEWRGDKSANAINTANSDDASSTKLSADNDRKPGNQEWKCPSCGKINWSYVGTCACGTMKPQYMNSIDK